MKEQKDSKTLALGDADYTRKKNRHKRVRTVIEFIVILLGILVLVHLFFTFRTYKPFSDSERSDLPTDTGFVALSYFGVDRSGNTNTLIGTGRLREHLSALKDQGYVTITQQDIIDYYQTGKKLPARSLFLMFEDGRRDTGIFAQGILEDLNYKATMMTYPEKFDNHDPKFLMPDELEEMEESSFWEMGTNGYRLEYINVFDRYDNYIGEIDPLRYAMISKYLGRRYNHFLMDYLRDKDGVPRESYEHMKERISYDYERLRDIYQESIGYVPKTYVLMHANTGRFGNNQQVSDINEKWIRELFSMNFNREGYSFNQLDSSIYDLTRMQPQPYWPINHLLMRIKYDINQPIEFVKGEPQHQSDWQLIDGAYEIKKECYTLTTLPEGRALSRLKAQDGLRDFKITTSLLGNGFGSQQIFLRADENLNRYVCVMLNNDNLIITEKTSNGENTLYKEKLAVILGEKILSVEEDRKEAEVTELQAFSRYAQSPDQAKEYLARAEQRESVPAATIEDGVASYEGTKSFHARGDSKIYIDLKDNKISVEVDDKEAAKDIEVSNTEKGSVFLGGSWKGEAWSQRNLADDVYDAVFDKFKIYSNTGKKLDEEKVVYTMELDGFAKYKLRAIEIWDSIIDWFVNYL